MEAGCGGVMGSISRRTNLGKEFFHDITWRDEQVVRLAVSDTPKNNRVLIAKI